jgi:hypothetical protein
MRPLTDRQANACEHAKSKRCRCRCGGALHGSARVGDRSQLPADDPHGPGSGQITLQPDPLDATIASATKALATHLAQPAEPVSAETVVDLMDALQAKVAREIPATLTIFPQTWQDIWAELPWAITQAPKRQPIDPPEDDGSDEDPEAYQ